MLSGDGNMAAHSVGKALVCFHSNRVECWEQARGEPAHVLIASPLGVAFVPFGAVILARCDSLPSTTLHTFGL